MEKQSKKKKKKFTNHVVKFVITVELNGGEFVSYDFCGMTAALTHFVNVVQTLRPSVPLAPHKLTHYLLCCGLP